MYYRIKEYIYSDFGTVKDPEVPVGVFFTSGDQLTQKFQEPMRFLVDNPSDDPPGAVMGISVPAFSEGLVNVFEKCGVDNLQLFDAVLINEKAKQVWDYYFAVNIIGKIACADIDASSVTEIAKRPGDATPLYKFQKLVIDPGKTQDKLIFRPAEQPGIIIVHEKLLYALDNNPNPKGDKWQISCFPIDEI